MQHCLANGDTNLGGSDNPTFYAADGGQRTALMQFDVSALDTDSLQNAVVQLKQIDGDYDDAPIEISVYAVTSAWTEGTGDNPWSGEGIASSWNYSATDACDSKGAGAVIRMRRPAVCLDPDSVESATSSGTETTVE